MKLLVVNAFTRIEVPALGGDGVEGAEIAFG